MSISRAVCWIIDGRDDGEEGSGKDFRVAGNQQKEMELQKFYDSGHDI